MGFEIDLYTGYEIDPSQIRRWRSTGSESDLSKYPFAVTRIPEFNQPKLRQRRYAFQPKVDPTQEELPWGSYPGSLPPNPFPTPTALHLPVINPTHIFPQMGHYAHARGDEIHPEMSPYYDGSLD
ncbi:hypothetical protein P3T73_03615 [Kiritimatiellota bacterium B12222]|nr:hypothetical protein P3T73_03615 [Kiritimatiellota bacterium B12222]